MKKLIPLILVFLFIPIIAFSQCIKDKYCDLKYPPAFDDWKIYDSLDYEKNEPGLGTSISYTTENAVITLYFYNRQLKFIENKDLEKEIYYFVADIKLMVDKGIYKILSPLKKLDSISINDTVLISQYTFEFKANKKECTSFIYLTSMKNNFVKVRLSFIKSEENILNRTAADVITKLYKKVIECSY